MKIRTGFVSNSSSSSFIIQKKNLSDFQIFCIKNHIQMGKIAGIKYAEPAEAWSISDEHDEIVGRTDMDNFRIADLFEKIGIEDNIVEWGS